MNQALKKFLMNKGYQLNDSLSSYVSIWKAWYRGNVEGFHKYVVYTGTEYLSQTRASLQLGKTICEQMANLLFNEKCGIAVDNEATDEFVKKVFDENNVYIKLNEFQERKAAFGTVCYIPYYADEELRMNYIAAENMTPLSWENGVINELAVHSKTVVDKKEYLFLQLFVLGKDGNYSIKNLMLTSSENGEEYSEVSLKEVKGYEKVKPEVDTESKTRPFIIDRLNISNNIDPDNPMGISIFANALDSMKFCDLVYDSYMNEFVLGKKRVMVASEAVNIMNGKPVFDPNDLVYYQLPEGVNADGKPFIHELNMELRSSEHQEALQQALNIFSSQCGLGENYYKFSGGSIATATQVVSENNTMFRTLKKHEIILEAALVDLIRLIIELGSKYGLAKGLKEESEITVTFDDSIIEDKNTELNRRLNEVAAGMLKPEIYLAYRYGVTEEKAKKMMPDMERGSSEEGMQ